MSNCCNPDCPNPATLLPRVKLRPLTAGELERGHATEARQRVLCAACDHYPELSCCSSCTAYSVAEVCRARGVEDPREIPIMLIPRSPVLMRALED